MGPMESGQQANLELVSRAYGALDGDDIPAFMELCATDAEWAYPAEGRLLYGGRWRGQDEIVRFFDTHDEAEEILDFRVDDMLADRDLVTALGFFRGRAKPSGRVWETRFAHAITIRGGLIQHFEAYFDTDAALQAHVG
jgi:ketosteroid isomerase-like protein